MMRRLVCDKCNDECEGEVKRIDAYLSSICVCEVHKEREIQRHEELWEVVQNMEAHEKRMKLCEEAAASVSRYQSRAGSGDDSDNDE
jgi:type II secretory pathway component PulJ